MNNHPTRGTCDDPTCKMYGLCHCGCGKRTTIVLQSSVLEGRTKNQPHIYIRGHASRSRFTIPVGPLQRELRRAVAILDWEKVRSGQLRRGQAELGRRYATRFGGSPAHATRTLQRILAANPQTQRANLLTADEWLTLIGSHLAYVYPELYYPQEQAA